MSKYEANADSDGLYSFYAPVGKDVRAGTLIYSNSSEYTHEILEVIEVHGQRVIARRLSQLEVLWTRFKVWLLLKTGHATRGSLCK